MDIGTITGIKKTDNGLECTIDFGANLIEEATLYGLSSSNDYPLPGDEVAVQTAGNQNVIVAVYRDIPDGTGQGETITYSRDSGGNIAASVKCGSNGEVILNGGADYAAEFTALKTGFDSLVAYVDAHTHLVAALPSVGTPPPTIPTLPPPVPSGATIDAAKVEKVRL